MYFGRILEQADRLTKDAWLRGDYATGTDVSLNPEAAAATTSR
jgi:hypothetical protein